MEIEGPMRESLHRSCFYLEICDFNDHTEYFKF
jgi:hypothetical protein